MKSPAFASAHGKIIIIGEHSVVYQYGAIVAPFTQALINVRIEEKAGEILIDSAYQNGLFFAKDAPIEGLQTLLSSFLLKYNLPSKDLNITITSNMLSRRGIGSSAAVAKAFVEALFKFFEIAYTRNDLVEFIKISELVYHAKPSGIDMTAILSDDLLWYQAGKFIPIKPKFSFYVIVVDSGTASQTKLSVSQVKVRVDAHEPDVIAALSSLGDLAARARWELENGNLATFAKLIRASQAHLTTIGVSTRELEQLIDFSLEHGALAAKLTGGGQGGCMFALFEEYNKCEKFVKIIKEQGVSHTWIMKID